MRIMNTLYLKMDIIGITEGILIQQVPEEGPKNTYFQLPFSRFPVAADS